MSSERGCRRSVLEFRPRGKARGCGRRSEISRWRQSGRRGGGLYANYPGNCNRIAGNGVLILGLPLLLPVAMAATAGLAIAIPLTATGFAIKACCQTKEVLKWSWSTSC
jgi:hypothetical protein